MRFRRGFGLLIATAGVSCGDPATSSSAPGDPAIASLGGTLPAAEVTSLVLLNVHVSDSRGNRSPHKPVTFSVIRGGGSVLKQSAMTDAIGDVVQIWTLGTVAGGQSVEVGYTNDSTGQSRVIGTIDITALPGPAVSQWSLTRQHSSIFAGLSLSSEDAIGFAPPRDQFGNAIPLPNFSLTAAGFEQSGGQLRAPTAANFLATLHWDGVDTVVSVHANDDLTKGTWDFTWRCFGPIVNPDGSVFDSLVNTSRWTAVSYPTGPGNVSRLRFAGVSIEKRKRYGDAKPDPTSIIDISVNFTANQFGDTIETINNPNFPPFRLVRRAPDRYEGIGRGRCSAFSAYSAWTNVLSRVP